MDTSEKNADKLVSFSESLPIFSELVTWPWASPDDVITVDEKLKAHEITLN